MSLIKSYQVGCEGGMLLIRRAIEPAATMDEQDELLKASKPERIELGRGCKFVTATEDTAAKARRVARKEGWIRVEVEHKAYPGADYTNKLKYDVCPVCAPKVHPLEKPHPPIHCLECDAPLSQEAGSWVDLRSGDHGGTYDHCPVSIDHVHRPAR